MPANSSATLLGPRDTMPWKVRPRGRSLPVWGILSIAFTALVIGHALLREYMPSPVLGVLGALLLVPLLGYTLLLRNDGFGFVMIIYCCSHFSYADNQGGLWNLMAAALITMHVATRLSMRLAREGWPGRDSMVALLLWVLIGFNVCGWFVLSPVGYIERVQGAAAFAGFILVFYVTSNSIITPGRFRAFMVITLVMFVYQLLVAVNQRYALFNINTPMLGAYGKGIGFITYGSTNAQGTLRHSELFGEYGLLHWCLLIPLLCSSSVQRELRIGSGRVLVMLLMSLTFIAITSTRSAALLAGAAIAVYVLTLKTVRFRSIDRFGRQIQLAVALTVLIPLVGAYIGVASVQQDFAEVGGTGFSLASIVSGEAINRAPLFELGIRRLSDESWFIGNGFGIPRANLWAWVGSDPLRSENMPADLHSLYLSLPMLYGWVGSAAFIGLILLAAWRSARAALLHRWRSTFLVPVAIGFGALWVAFLVDQFKISMLRNPNYHMMFWVWLGMTMAVIRTLASLPLEIRHSSRIKGVPVPQSVEPFPKQSQRTQPKQILPAHP